mgnify:CR=1 FL=1
MWKKTLLALAAVAALTGFGLAVESTPAAAQGMYRPPRAHAVPMRAPRPMIARPMHRPGSHIVRPPHRHWHGPRHRWYGGGWGYGYGYRYRGWATPPGVYGYYAYPACHVEWRKVRVWTDDGWRRRWRKVRICS